MRYCSPIPPSPERSGKRPDRRAGLTPLEEEYDEELEKGFWSNYRKKLLACLLGGFVSLFFMGMKVLYLFQGPDGAEITVVAFLPLLGGILIASLVLPVRWYLHHKQMVEVYGAGERDDCSQSDPQSSDGMTDGMVSDEIASEESQVKWVHDDVEQEKAEEIERSEVHAEEAFRF